MKEQLKIRMVKACRKIIRIIASLTTRISESKIILVVESPSGSNSYALWKYADDNIKKNYEVIRYDNSPDETMGFCALLKKYRDISSAKLILTTHQSFKPTRKHIHVQLWHGAFIKKNGVMIDKKRNGDYRVQKSWIEVDYIMSYSETYSTFFNACMLTDPNKYVVTGAPRNDFLFKSDGRQNLSRIFGEEIEGKRLILFLPSFREWYAKDQSGGSGNLFGFKDFSSGDFDSYLQERNLKIIFKPHPDERSVVLEQIERNAMENILVLSDDDLAEKKIDLYELLNGTDLLLTDFSSVYYDYLLLGRPIVFVSSEIDSYDEERGFLIESFEAWTPGPKVTDEGSLREEVDKCLEDKGYYGKTRSMMLDTIHRYKDGRSSERFWGFISKILDK